MITRNCPGSGENISLFTASRKGWGISRMNQDRFSEDLPLPLRSVGKYRFFLEKGFSPGPRMLLWGVKSQSRA